MESLEPLVPVPLGLVLPGVTVRLPGIASQRRCCLLSSIRVPSTQLLVALRATMPSTSKLTAPQHSPLRSSSITLYVLFTVFFNKLPREPAAGDKATACF